MTPRILSFGMDIALMSSRTLILSGAGYEVEEAFSADTAVRLVELDSIDVTLICHTVPPKVLRILVAMVMKKRRLMPVLFIRAFPYQDVPPNCIGVENDPVALLNVLAEVSKRQPVFAIAG
jgi:DNA-binding response OmpR family regulator